jgi:hypothetical protein
VSPALRQASDLLRGSHFRVEMPVPPGARHAVVSSAATLRDRTFLLRIPASVQSVPIGNGGMIFLPVAARVQPVGLCFPPGSSLSTVTAPSTSRHLPAT